MKGDITFHYILIFDFSNNKIVGNMSDFTQIVDFNEAETINISGNPLDGELTVNMPDGIPGITAKGSKIEVNTDWFPQDNFISAKDLLGNDISFNNIKVTGNV